MDLLTILGTALALAMDAFAVATAVAAGLPEWTARHTFRPERPLQPWVRTIARNAVIDWARRQTRARAKESGVEAANLAAPERSEHSPVMSRAVERALSRLPESQRKAVVMLKVEDLTVAEAAERAGISQGALKLRAHRGYRTLRDLLGRELL